MSNDEPLKTADPDGWEEPPVTKDHVLFCFFCNRPELHFHGLRGRWFFSILVGFTFGLIYRIGPFRCRCCGHTRFFSFERFHPSHLATDFGDRMGKMRLKWNRWWVKVSPGAWWSEKYQVWRHWYLKSRKRRKKS